MRNTNKKGFTIVELVIVVAVIAILAAVLIPTFSGIIAKAKLSADKKAVHEMNTFIAMEEADTFEEALAALEKNKINTENLAPISAGYSFVWNSETNTIELVETKEDTVDIIESIKNEDVTVSTADYLILAVNSGSKNIKLGADITIAEDLNVREEGVTLDLNGHTYNTVQASNGRSGVIYIRKGGSLTVKNGTFNVRSLQNEGTLTVNNNVTINAMDVTGGGCLRNKAGATLTIEGGAFNVVNFWAWGDSNYGGAAGVHNDGGVVIIKDGTFTSNTDAYLISNINGGTMTIEAGTFTAHRGALYTANSNTVVNGGTFKVTHDSNSGCTAMHSGTGSTTLNGGEYSHVVDGRTFSGCGK